MKEPQRRRLCAVSWLRHKSTGGGGIYHEPDSELAPEGLQLTTKAGFRVPVQVCAHCGCVYVTKEE